MASRCRGALSRTVCHVFKSGPSIKPASPPSLPRLSSPSFSRVRTQISMLESLLPLHSAVSSARLTSRLGTDSMRSLSQESGQSIPR